jgi:hypothetical protein
MYASLKALREDFIARIISRGLWLPRYPDLPPCDFLWCDEILKELKPEEEQFFVNPPVFFSNNKYLQQDNNFQTAETFAI